MTQAPERIWACPKHMLEWENSVDCSSVKVFAHDVEYVRADLYAALEAQLAEAQAKPSSKKLEWLSQGFEQDADLVDTTFTYQIQEGNLWYGCEVMPTACGTNEDAMNAAQADWDRRWVSAQARPTVAEAAKVLIEAGLTDSAISQAHREIDWCRNEQNTSAPDHSSQRPGSTCAEDIKDAFRAALRALSEDRT